MMCLTWVHEPHYTAVKFSRITKMRRGAPLESGAGHTMTEGTDVAGVPPGGKVVYIEGRRVILDKDGKP